jgi:sugar-specific transcriptional regulator TrmB
LKDVNRLSKGWMEKTLIKLGFTEIDVGVYFYLNQEGPRKINEIAEALKLYRKKLFRILKRLQSKGIIVTSQENPDSFSVLPFEKVLDLFIEIKKEQAKALLASKEELLSSWRSIAEKEDEKS